MKNLFNGKKKWICLLIICLLLVGFVVIGYNSLNKKVTTSSTTNGDNKEANSQTEENKENGSVAQEENKGNTTTSNEGSKNDTTVNTNTNNSTKPNSGSSSKPSNGGSTSNSGSTSNGGTTSNSGSGSTSKPENKPTTPSKPENKPSKPENKPSNGGTSKPSHTHNWVAQTKQVHHKEQGHYEDVLVKPAWTEEVPVYEERERSICNGCRKDITSNPYKHMEDALMAGNTKCGGFHSEWKKVQVGTKKVHHKAQYKKKWVVDKKAWTETVVTGHKCSGCGQTK